MNVLKKEEIPFNFTKNRLVFLVLISLFVLGIVYSLYIINKCSNMIQITYFSGIYWQKYRTITMSKYICCFLLKSFK